MKSIYVAIVIAVSLSFVGVVKAFSLSPTQLTKEPMVYCKSADPSAECYNRAGYIVGTYDVISTKTSSIEIGDGV